MWWRDYERAAVELLCDQGRHVRFTKTHNVREKHTAVFFKNFSRTDDSFLLIFQAFEIVRDVNVFQFSRPIQFVAEVFVQKLQIKLVRREVREGRAICNRIVVRLPKIDGNFPQLIKLGESEFVIGTRLQLDVKLKIIEKTRLGKVARPSDHATFVAVAF